MISGATDLPGARRCRIDEPPREDHRDELQAAEPNMHGRPEHRQPSLINRRPAELRTQPSSEPTRSSFTCLASPNLVGPAPATAGRARPEQISPPALDSMPFPAIVGGAENHTIPLSFRRCHRVGAIGGATMDHASSVTASEPSVAPPWPVPAAPPCPTPVEPPHPVPPHRPSSVGKTHPHLYPLRRTELASQARRRVIRKPTPAPTPATDAETTAQRQSSSPQDRRSSAMRVPPPSPPLPTRADRRRESELRPDSVHRLPNSTTTGRACRAPCSGRMCHPSSTSDSALRPSRPGRYSPRTTPTKSTDRHIPLLGSPSLPRVVPLSNHRTMELPLDSNSPVRLYRQKICFHHSSRPAKHESHPPSALHLATRHCVHELLFVLLVGDWCRGYCWVVVACDVVEKENLDTLVLAWRWML